MEKEKILQADMLDILFEGRNKDYGAYELRRTYNRRMGKALMVTGSVIVLVLASYYISAKGMKGPMAKRLDVTPDIFLQEPDRPLPPPPPPPPRAVVPELRMVQFVSPVVVPDRQVPPDEKPPVQDEMDNARIGNMNKEGNDDPEIVAPPAGNGREVTEAPAKPKDDDGEIVFRKVEIESEYPGGKAAWARYLNKNLYVPQEAMDEGIQGTVVVEFIVDQEGNVSDAHVVGGPEQGGLGAEVVRVIGKSGKWTPAIQNGRRVKSYKRQPVTINIVTE